MGLTFGGRKPVVGLKYANESDTRRRGSQSSSRDTVGRFGSQSLETGVDIMDCDRVDMYQKEAEKKKIYKTSIINSRTPAMHLTTTGIYFHICVGESMGAERTGCGRPTVRSYSLVCIGRIPPYRDMTTHTWSEPTRARVPSRQSFASADSHEVDGRVRLWHLVLW